MSKSKAPTQQAEATEQGQSTGSRIPRRVWCVYKIDYRNDEPPRYIARFTDKSYAELFLRALKEINPESEVIFRIKEKLIDE